MISLKQITLLAAGGDLRQITAAKRLAEHHSVSMTGFDRFGALPADITAADLSAMPPHSLDALLLPMPVTQDGLFLFTPFSGSAIRLASLLPLVRAGGTVFGGRFRESERRMIESAGLRAADYAEQETFALRNAVPTAEGAIQIIMQELPVVCRGSPA